MKTPLLRRNFLADLGMGFTGLSLGAILCGDGIVRATTPGWQPPDGKPHFPPKANRVIWLLMIGSVSPVETVDPKPTLPHFDFYILTHTHVTTFQPHPQRHPH